METTELPAGKTRGRHRRADRRRGLQPLRPAGGRVGIQTHADSYPLPGCQLCEEMAREAGHASVADYLAEKAAA